MQSSDGGALLLREVEQRTRIVQRLAAQFVDYRSPELIEHSVTDLLMQRVFGLALGYEDLNDHDALRLDHLLALAMGKEDPTGATRKRSQDRGLPLASFEHIEPPGADDTRCYRTNSIQEDRGQHGRHGRTVGVGIS